MGGSRTSRNNSPVPVNSDSVASMASRNGSRTRNGAQRTSSSSYEDIMGHNNTAAAAMAAESCEEANKGETDGPDAVQALSSRLVAFRKWLKDSGVVVHPAICIVNGEATDGTKNAPVLVFGPPGNNAAVPSTPTGRVGAVDGDGDRALYDRTMGCQLRAVREMKQGEVVLTMPRSAMITPDLVASSDAGRAVLACCRAPEDDANSETLGFWDVLENTVVCEEKGRSRILRNSGPQLLVKILQERKRVETAFNKRQKQALEGNCSGGDGAAVDYLLASVGAVSTRAPFLAFLIHQRFSNSADPSVSLSSTTDEFCGASDNIDGNALLSSKAIMKPIGSLDTFAPYARTLPSSVALPLCWKRNELALLAGCIPGAALLYDVASSTYQLAAEFIALLEAGVLERFPQVFPEGLLTWERWVWAAAVFSSRTLPVSCYINSGEEDAYAFSPEDTMLFQSQPEIWQELGVMIPLLDMTNHEAEENQVTWKPCIPDNDPSVKGEGMDLGDDGSNSFVEPHPPRAVLHKKVRKGSELFLSYGQLGNQNLILHYGFAQMNNLQDEVRMGWGLSDAVGGVDLPSNYIAVEDLKLSRKNRVFESTEAEAINTWWSAYRLEILEGVAFKKHDDDSFMANLKAGKKMTASASSDGTYDPFLLMAALVATMPIKSLMKYSGSDTKLVVSKLHQRILRDYLMFIFTRKLEKLLQNLENGLKAHFGNFKLWTKVAEGGLKYKPEESNSEEPQFLSWQSFFDSHAYSTAMEVEKRYYAMGTESCVLTLYDGQLRALQASIDGVADVEKFRNGILRQLEDLDFEISNGEESNDDHNNNDESVKSPGANGNDKKAKNRRRNRKKGASTASGDNRPPASKLHIGNLSYSTTPSDLYDAFAAIYGTDNILECHIPTERDTQRSRGFGFVTLPENVAMQALRSGQKHEIDGRLLKVARSNSAGSSVTPKSPPIAQPPASSGDRCATCGYRPKYCVCQASNGKGSDSRARSSGGASADYGRDYSYYGSGGRHRDDRPRDDPPSYRDRERGEEVDRYGRVYDRDHSRSYEYRYDERGDERNRGRSRHADDRRRSRDRSRSSGRGSSRYETNRRSRSPEEGRISRRGRAEEEDEGEWSRRRKRSSSRSRERGRKKKSKRRERSHSLSLSPHRGEK